jgi:acyl-coenzyme A thioesterase PaaI-like protein
MDNFMDIQKRIKELKPLQMNHHFSSFVSSDSEDRIKIQYYFDKHSCHFLAHVVFGQKSQGPPGHVHGGAIASVLDESMGAAAWMNGFTAMTVKLEINYFRVLKIGNEAFVETWVDHNNEKKVWVKGKIITADGIVYAESNGLIIPLTKKYFQSMGDIPEELFNDF